MTNIAENSFKGHYIGERYVKASALRVDTGYQHELSHSRVAKIAKEWADDVYNPPKVSLREDGSYWIVNGQHTTEAYKKVYGEDALILCRVYSGLTWEDEVKLFLAQNGTTGPVTALDKLRAMYNANDPDVRNMVAACAHCGVKVYFCHGYNSKTKYVCGAPDAMFAAYKALTPSLFFRMVALICKTWEGEQASFHAGIVRGLARLYALTGGSFKDSEMSKSLAKYTPDYYAREAREMNGRLDVRYSKLFARVYNVKRRVNRIEIEEENG